MGNVLQRNRLQNRITRGLALSVLAIVLSSPGVAQGNNDGNAMSPVGAWDTKVFDSDGNLVLSDLTLFHAGGTMTNIASTSTPLTSYGTWKKVGGNEYIRVFRFFLIDSDGQHFGYWEARHRFWLIDKDTLEGETQADIMLGTDPFNPTAVFPVPSRRLTGRRLPSDGLLPWR